MITDPRLEGIFIELFAEAHRSALNLDSSLRRLAKLLPIDSAGLENLSEDDKDRLDAFRVRFADLQDVLGRKLFRSLLLMEEEEIGSMLDILTQMEKRGILSSLEEWRRIIDLRNLLTHDYPRSRQERAEALNGAYAKARSLLEIFWGLRRYAAERLGLKMDGFPPSAAGRV